MICYVVASIICLSIYFFRKNIYQRWFAYWIHRDSQIHYHTYKEVKKDLFKPIHAIVSHNPRLKKGNSISILEIGVGTGANFEYYPDGTNLVVIDPNPYFKSYYDKNRDKFTNIKSEEIILTTGEDMDMIESNSVDAVVMTLVMCQVKDIKKLLRNIHRILTPGGKYFFLEHIKETDEKKISWILKIFQFFHHFFGVVTSIWRTKSKGCHSHRDELAAIQSTGFSDVDTKRKYLPLKRLFFTFDTPHILGVATK